MPVQNPFGLSFSGNITQWDNTPLSPPSAFGTCPGLGCCSNTTSVLGVNASLFVGSCTALTATNFGSPAQESLNVYVVNPLTVTFTETELAVTQGTSPWVVSGTVCATQCTTPWVVNVADWNGVAVGSPTAWGTAPTGNVVGTNSELFAGNTALTATGTSLNVNLTGGTVCVTQCTSPWVVSLASTTITGTVTVAGNLTHNNAAPIADNVGVLPALATTAPPAYTAGDQVLLNTTLAGAIRSDNTSWAGTALGAPTTWGTAPTGNTVIGTNSEMFAGGTALTATGTSLNVNVTGTSTTQGNLTNNNATPNAFNLGVLPAIAESAYTNLTYTSGNQVLPATDLHGALFSDLAAVANITLGATAVVNFGSAPAAVAVPAVNASLFSGVTPLTNTGGALNTNITGGSVAVTQGTSPWVVSLTSTTITGTTTVAGNLTNNNAAPAATNLGVLPAIAESAYTNLTYTTGNQVLPATDLHGALMSDLEAVAGVALGATAVTAFGTAPAAVNVPAVNASLFSGTTPLTNTGGALNVNVTNPTSSTVAGSLTNNNAAPVANNMGVLGFIAETAYATATYTTGNQVLAVTDLHGAVNTDWQALAGTALGGPTTWGTAPTAEQVQGVNAFCIQGTSPWVVSLASTTITGTVAVTQSTSPWVVSLASTTITGTVTTAGNLTNNNAAPAANNVGVLPAIAESAYTNLTYTSGDQVLPATDLHGALMSDLEAVAGVALGATAVVNYGSTPAAVAVPAVNAFITNTPAVTVSGTVAVTQSTSPWVVSLASTTITGTVTTQGNLTNNNAAPNAFNLGVLPAIAEGTYTTLAYTSGDQVLPATDSHGALWSDLAAVAGTALGATAVVAFGGAVAAVNVPAVNSSLYAGTTGLTATGTSLNVNVTNSTSSTVAGNLTNNNAAPNAFNLGVLPAIAETAYTTASYTTGNQVLPTTDLHGALWSDIGAVAGTALGATAVVAYGSTPAAVNVPAVNAFITNVPAVTVNGTVAVTQSTSPWVVSLASTTITGTVTTQGNLTNNNAVPNAFNLGVLPAIAETAYTTVTYTTGDQVLPVTDLHGALNQDLQAVAGIQLGATAVTAFGTAPAAVNVPAVNASLFAGTTPLTMTGTSLNVDVTNTLTMAGNKSNNAVVPGATNLGVLPGIANAATQTWTEGDQVLESMDLSGRQRVRGTLTNNNAAPAADQLAVMPAVVAPSNTTFNTYTAGDQVLLNTDLQGNLNSDMQYWAGVDLGTPTNFGTTPGAVIAGSVNSSLFIGTVAAVAASAGVQKVGISGGTGASVDSAASGGTAPTNALLTSGEYNTTPLVLTNGQAGALQSDTTGALYVNIEGRKQTYSCFATFTPVAGDIAVLPGSASKTIRITRVEVSMSTSGTAGVEAVTLVKRSSADTAGTSAAMTAVPHDSNYAAASAAPLRYTAAPTLGTAVGTIRGIQFFDDSNAATGANTWLWDFGTRGGAACIVLRGVAQQLCINLGAVIATQTVTVSYEWEEDNS